LFQWLAL